MMEIIRMIVVLSAITGLSGFILSGLKQWTTPIIEEQILTNVQGPALELIFTEGDNDPIADRQVLTTADGQEVMVFPSLKGNKLVAVAMEAAGSGYGGDVNVLVGFDITKDVVSAISITTHQETPGLGTRIEEPSFTKQFRGLPIDKAAFKKDGGDIDSISGATSSAFGATMATNQATQWYADLKDSIKTTW